MMIVRCDANAQWGMGHLTRCRALAVALHRVGIPVAMVGPERKYAQVGDDDLFAHWQPMAWHDDTALGAHQLLDLAEQWQAEGLILDEPRADEVYQKVLFDARLPWLHFDGTAQKPLWASWVLNALPSANANDYAKVLRNPAATLLLGPAYAVLRSEFAAVRSATKSAQPFNILLSFGGGDDRGAMAWCINALLPLLGDHTHLKIISGQANPRNGSNLAHIPASHSAWVVYAIQPPAPWTLMSQCDMAVMASGTTAHEANCCHLPMVLMSVVNNQHAPGLAWQQAGQAQYLGPWDSVSQSSLQLSVAQCMQDIRSGKPQANTLVDGLGAIRVAQAIQNLIHSHPVETL
jgi:spore coat polysaccharide biosynthesis predicted glycosyltransferase SpsG